MPSGDVPDILAPVANPLAGLAGCRVVVAGFSPEAANDVIQAFSMAGAQARAGGASSLEADAKSCDLMLVSLPSLDEFAELLRRVPAPVIAAVTPGTVMGYLPLMRQFASECIFYPCSDQEILCRAVLAIHRWAPAAERAPQQRTFRIVLADDDPAVTDLLKAALEHDRMQCRCTRNGVQTLEVIREWRPDIIVLDVNMPSMDGYQVLAALQQDGNRAPVLMLTGRDHADDVTRGFKLGAKDYVVKPFNPFAVVTRIRRLLKPA